MGNLDSQLKCKVRFVVAASSIVFTVAAFFAVALIAYLCFVLLCCGIAAVF